MSYRKDLTNSVFMILNASFTGSAVSAPLLIDFILYDLKKSVRFIDLNSQAVHIGKKVIT